MRIGKRLEIIGSSMLIVLAFVVLVIAFGHGLTTAWLLLLLVGLGVVLWFNARRVERSYAKLTDPRRRDQD